jgi:uncharacterized protein
VNTYPGVYIEEVPSASRTIFGVDTSVTAFVGRAPIGPINKATYIDCWASYQEIFGGLSKESKMSYSINHYFQNGGTQAIIVRADDAGGNELTKEAIIGSPQEKTGLYALKSVDIFNLLCIPAFDSSDESRRNVYNIAESFCELKRAILLVDPPIAWKTVDNAKNGIDSYVNRSKNAALFFPKIKAIDPIDQQIKIFDPCGAVAGVISRIDAQRGIWKASAGLEATLNEVCGLDLYLNNNQNAELNPLGINCLRKMHKGFVVWGARTLQGKDSFSNEWKYLPIRRTALFIEESVYRGTMWVGFESNDERLWSQIRLNVGAFMQSLYIKGAFQGSNPKQAYFVKCDSETTTSQDVNRGIVNIVLGFAPLKPAEFVIIKIQQKTGT